MADVGTDSNLGEELFCIFVDCVSYCGVCDRRSDYDKSLLIGLVVYTDFVQ